MPLTAWTGDQFQKEIIGETVLGIYRIIGLVDIVLGQIVIGKQYHRFGGFRTGVVGKGLDKIVLLAVHRKIEVPGKGKYRLKTFGHFHSVHLGPPRGTYQTNNYRTVFFFHFDTINSSLSLTNSTLSLSLYFLLLKKLPISLATLLITRLLPPTSSIPSFRTLLWVSDLNSSQSSPALWLY